MKMSGIKNFLNCYVQKRFAMKFIYALPKWLLWRYLHVFPYSVITAK